MSLRPTVTIMLPEHVLKGGFDHAAIHYATNRLYIAHTANDSLDLVDCSTNCYLASIPGLTGVAGALVSEERKLVFCSNRGENTISIFQPGAEHSLVKIPVGIHPNGLSFDPRRGHLLCANVGDPDNPNSYTLSIVDVQKRKMIHSIPVPGRTRWSVFDAHNNEFYTNISEPAEIIVVDANRPDHVVRSLPIPAAGPHGLDLDADTGRLFCSCDEGKLVTLESTSGKILNSVDISGKPDVIFFNRVLKHLYVAVGDPGVIDVMNTDSYSRLETVSTEKGAHTLAFDGRFNKLYAFVPQTHSAKVFIDK